jgi:hypothetical protein
VGRVKSRLLNVISQYEYAYGEVPDPDLTDLGAVFLNC